MCSSDLYGGELRLWDDSLRPLSPALTLPCPRVNHIDACEATESTPLRFLVACSTPSLTGALLLATALVYIGIIAAIENRWHKARTYNHRDS